MLPNGVAPDRTLYLAALQAGCYYVPINYRLRRAEIAYILSDSDAKAFVSHERFADARRHRPPTRRAFPRTARLAARHDPGLPVRSTRSIDGQPTTLPDDRSTGASMHYTSGTTGKPKGVKRALAEIDPDTSAELFTFLLQLFGITPRDGNVHLSTSPNYHTAVTTFAGNSLHMKHTVVCMDKWDPEETLRLIERYRLHAHAHGADAVHPHAAAARRGARRSTTCRR